MVFILCSHSGSKPTVWGLIVLLDGIPNRLIIFNLKYLFLMFKYTVPLILYLHVLFKVFQRKERACILLFMPLTPVIHIISSWLVDLNGFTIFAGSSLYFSLFFSTKI